jgi:fatty acid amide hydrolase
LYSYSIFNMPEDSTVYFVASVAVGLKVMSSLKNRAERERISTIAAKKRKCRDSVNHQIFHKPNNKELDLKIYRISDSIELLEQFKSGQLSRADTILALSRRSCEIGRKELDSVAEELYDEAYLEAKSLDDDMHEDFASLPMLGLPVSIKDCVHMKGCDTTMGAVARCFKPEPEDGLLVQLLRRAGCIPFVRLALLMLSLMICCVYSCIHCIHYIIHLLHSRTNVPQLLLMPESDNAIWGQAKNPYDTSRTPGGSSGGEAALIAARGSFLGLGSDIGGSIRIPAHYCGIVGFKPTPGRVTKKGSGTSRLNDRDGQIVIPSTTGPMARSVRDCVLMMQALVNQSQDDDLEIPSIPWNNECVQSGNNSKMRVAVMMTDGWFEPFPGCKRAVQEAAEALVASGHEVVPFELPVPTSDMIRTYFRAMGADGNWFSLLRALEGEELSDSYKSLQAYTNIPNFLRPLIKNILDMLGEHRKALMLGSIKNGGLGVREYWEVIADVKEIKAAYTNAFARHQYDAVLMPGLGVTALPHGMAPELLSALSYTFLGNLLAWPAGTVPVTTTRSDEEVYTAPAYEQDSMFRLGVQACRGSTGLPVGVQVMTPRWQDEKCLFLMREIEKNVQFSAQPSKYAV